jgi:alpha-glucosidase
MFFSKSPYRSNFRFLNQFQESSETTESGGGILGDGEKHFSASLRSFEGGIAHFQLQDGKLWGPNRAVVDLNSPEATSGDSIQLTEKGELIVRHKKKKLMTGRIGVCNTHSMFEFELAGESQFFGMGEKYFGQQELSGYRAKFWNTDVWSDFHFAQWGGFPSDPPYYSAPYVVVRQGDVYIGLLLHNPSPAFMETPGTDDSRVFVEWQRTWPNLIIGNEGGEPNLWIIVGPTLPELTQKLQKLVGVTPLPPLWSLGYHQSRWGYGGHDDLLMLDKKFEEHQIPCDGLWMDLDYMREFRIFSVDTKAFPTGQQATADILEKNGRRIIPIIDPGVKFETGYDVYDDGHKHMVFCQTSEGREYIGLVWPGETVFPDFTQAKVRNWWADYAAKFRVSGFGGCWVDMNDPSTGPVDPYEMWFNNGKDHHNLHRNQYSLAMQMATFDGFLKAKPNERPFILSRSGFIGTSRYAAIWTGDNCSNYFYLANSIPCSIGMSLSGQPFAGMDIGGFGGDVTDDLMVDWIKLAFLFPFTRNHNGKGNRDQEPFAFPTSVMSTIRRYIRLRYKLLPYLYNLFIQQEESGDPILRPVLYHYSDVGTEKLDDQFMIGADILQAPFVDQEKTREVTLPGQQAWYDARSGEWVAPGVHTVKRGKEETPLYIRAGAILPMQPGTPTSAEKEMKKVNFHLFIPDGWTGESEYVYKVDDGISFDYQRGIRSAIAVNVIGANGHIMIDLKELADDFGSIEPTFVIHGTVSSVKLKGQSVSLKSGKVTLSGKPLNVKFG